jgi:uncharacterized protein YraI
MRIAAAFLALVLLTVSSAAQPDLSVRGYYRVAGLAPGDTLNVREGPSTGAAIIGILEANEEVFATGASRTPVNVPWFEINFGERLGWASSRYLRRMQVRTFAGTRAPVAGSCGGFEPGWDAEWNSAGLRASEFGQPLGQAPIAGAAATAGFSTPSVLTFARPGPGPRFTLILRDDVCTLLPVDSDSYQTGLLIVERGGALTAYAGCCNAAAAAIGP